MIRQARRLAYPLLMATMVVTLLTSGVVGWAASTSCSSSTYKICVSYNDGNGTPRAVTNLDDYDYGGDKYYNSITNIEDTVSSVKNLLPAQDVFFFWDPGANGGTTRCVDSNSTVSDLGWWSSGDDDKFSAHATAANDGPC